MPPASPSNEDEECLQGEYDGADSEMKELEKQMLDLQQQQKDRKVLKVSLKQVKNAKVDRVQIVGETADKIILDHMFGDNSTAEFPITLNTNFSLEFFGKSQEFMDISLEKSVLGIPYEPIEDLSSTSESVSTTLNSILEMSTESNTKSDVISVVHEGAEASAVSDSWVSTDFNSSSAQVPFKASESQVISEPTMEIQQVLPVSEGISSSIFFSILVKSIEIKTDSDEGQWVYKDSTEEIGVCFTTEYADMKEEDAAELKKLAFEITAKYDAASLTRSKADKKLKKIRSSKNMKIKKTQTSKSRSAKSAPAVERGFLNKKKVKESDGRLKSGWKKITKAVAFTQATIMALKNPLIFGVAVAFFAAKGGSLAV